jgi:hypothetical protein
MRRRGHIDRTKHEVDITERVLEGGVWAAGEPVDAGRVVDLRMRVEVWPLGTIASAVQVQTIDRDSDER